LEFWLDIRQLKSRLADKFARSERASVSRQDFSASYECRFGDDSDRRWRRASSVSQPFDSRSYGSWSTTIFIQSSWTLLRSSAIVIGFQVMTQSSTQSF
jgi:hypothetical protein